MNNSKLGMPNGLDASWSSPPLPKDTSVLVSLIVVAAGSLHGSETSIHKASAFLAERYAFFEILLVTTDSDAHSELMFAHIAQSVPQGRLLQIEGKPDFDELAVQGYMQSIGDVVILTSSDEIPFVDIDAIVSRLRAGTQLVRLKRTNGGGFEALASGVVRILTGLEVDTRYYRTLALTRQILSQLLAEPDQMHFFRFRASASIVKQETLRVTLPRLRRGLGPALARVEIVLHLVSASSVRLLRVAAAACAAFSLVALLASLYPIVLLVAGWQLAEGWTSTIMLLSSWACVQLAATAVISLGVSRVLEKQENRLPRRVANERLAGELFAQANILNVERNESNPSSGPMTDKP